MDRETKVQEFVAQLEANPYDLGPMGRLEEAFAVGESWDDLVNIFETRAVEVASRDAAARLFLEAARMAGTRLNDAERSIELLSKSLTVGEDTLVSIEAHLFSLAIQQEGDQLLEFFSQALEHDTDGAYQSRLYQRMGCILEEFLGDADEADNAYKWALDLDPANVAALWSRKVLARRQAAWARLADLLVLEIESSEDLERQAELSVTVGELYRDYLDSAESAAQCFAFALDADPANSAARKALEELGYLEAEADAELTPEVIAEAEDRPMTMELDEAMLLDEGPPAMPEIPGGFAVADEDSEEEDIVMAMPASEEVEEDAAPFEDAGLSASAPAEDHFVGSFDVAPDEDSEGEVAFEAVSAVVEDESEAQADAIEEAVEAEEFEEFEAEPLEDELLEEASDEEVVEEEAVEEEAADDEVIEEAVEEELLEEEHLEEAPSEAEEAVLDEQAEEEDEEGPTSWRHRFMTMRASAREATDQEDALRLLVRAARLESRHREDEGDGLSLWAQAFQAGVAQPFYRRTNYLFDGDDFWSSVMSAIDGAGLEDGMALKARIALYQFGDADQARQFAEQAQDAEILGALDDLAEATENWRKFQRTLEQRHADLDADEKAKKVYLRMADLAAALKDSDKEIDALRRLERQVDDGQVRNRLKVLYKGAGKWPMYVELVKQEVETLEDDRVEDKVDLLYEVIRVYRQEMNNDRMAINVYKEILGLAPEDTDAIDQLIEIYGAMNMSSDLINMLQTKAELARGKAAKVAIYAQIAELFLEKFRNQAEAIKAYEAVLEIEPYHLPAIAFLKEMYEKRRDWESLIDVHKRQIETFQTMEEKAAGYKEVAQLATDKLRKPEVATELWLEVRRFAHDDVDALDALETLYEKNRDYAALAEIIEEKVGIAGSVDDKMKLYQKLGMLYADRLEDSGRAMEAWKGALALQPDDLKARKALERLYIDNRAWDELEGFYAQNGAHSDLVRLLGTLTGTMKEDDVKIELLLRAARLWRTELGDTNRAERELERALQIDPRNEGAALLLAPIYEEAGNTEKLKESLEIILSHRTEPEERRKYQLDLAALHRDALEDWSGAFDWFARAFEEMPESDEVTADLEYAAGQSENWPAVVKLYEAVLGMDLELEDRQSLRLRLGRVLSEELNAFDEALAQFEAVLAEEKDNLKALASMERIFTECERWDDLMSVYRHRLELEGDRDARVGILQGMAAIAENQAQDLPKAIARFNEALALDIRNEETLQQLHRLYRVQGQHEELAQIIRQEVDLVERRARMNTRQPLVAGTLALDGLIGESAQNFGQVAEASLFGEGLSEGPESVSEALSDLGGLGAESSVSRGEESAEFVAADGDVEVSDAQLEAEDVPVQTLEDVDLAGHPHYTESEIDWLVELRYELGLLCLQHLGQYEEALENLGRVVAWRPDHVDASAALEGLLEFGDYRLAAARVLEAYYEVHGQWEAYVRTLEIQVEASEDDAEAISLLQRIGQTYLNELGDGVRSFESYAAMLRREASSTHARAQLRRVAGALGVWGDLVALYEDILPTITDDALRISYFFALGGFYGRRLDDAVRAESYLHKILDAEPESAQALDELEDLHIRTESWEKLKAVYDLKLGLAESAADIEELKFRIAAVWKDLLGDPRQAIGIYQEILDADAENVRALRELGGLFESEGMWIELSENLERELELVEDAEKHGVKNRLAAVAESHLGDADRAVDLYESVLDEAPDNVDALEAMEVLMMQETAPRGRISRILEPLFVDSDDWSKLIQALDVQVETNDAPAERVELRHRIARLYEARAESLQDAFDTYSKALHDDVANERTLENLYRIADAAQGEELLVAVFEDEAARQAEPEVKRDMLRRAASLYIEPLEHLTEAAERLHEVLDLFPADLETVEELETIYRHTQDWRPLVDILVRKAEIVEEVPTRKDLLYQAGTLHEDILDGPEDAIDVYNIVLSIDEDDIHAIDRLEVLYTQLERWHDLLDIYRKKLELAGDDDGRKDLLYVMGAIFQEHLEQPQDAIDTYARVLELDPNELAALEKLDELYELTEQWPELLETLERELALAQSPDDAQQLKYRTGRLFEVHLGDVLRGIEVFREVLVDNPDHGPTTEALEALIERGEHEVEAAEVLKPIYEDGGEWEKLVHVYRLLIQATSDPDLKLELFGQVAHIFEIRLDDPKSAFDAHVEALAVEPGRQETLETLERLAHQLQHWNELITEIDNRLEDLSDYDAAAGLTLRVARILEEELDDAPSAILRYQRVLELDPSEDRAILALDRLYQREGQWPELAEILRTRVLNTNEPDEALKLRLRLGMLYQSALEDEDSAIETYQTVLMEDPENQTAIESLEQMFMAGQAVQRISDILEPYYLDKGQHEKLVEIYLQRLEMIDDPSERYDLLMQVARIFLDELKDAGRALQAYGAALNEKPDDEQVMGEIERLAGAIMDWGAAAGFLAEALESKHITDEAAALLWARLARILDEELESFEDAEMAYHKTLEFDPGQTTALEALDRIYLSQGRWADLAQVIGDRIAGTYDEIEVVDLSFRQAEIFQNQLADFDRAVETYEKVLSIQPDHEDALRRLEQIHEGLQSWDNLYDVLDRRGQLTHDPDEQAELFARMATLAEQMLDRRLDAIDLWGRVSELRPDDIDALGELRRLYLAEERWDDLVSVLEREVELRYDPTEKLGLYESLGTIYGDYLQNEGQAQDAWQNVLLIDPEHLTALEALRDLYTRQGDYGELAGILERLIEHMQIDQPRKLELWIELGEVQGDMLMNADQAIHAWKNVLGLDPDNGLAIDNLERLFIQEAMWEDAAQVLELKADRTDDAFDRIDLYSRIADIWENKLFERQNAGRYYEAILELDPRNEQASQSLEAIYVEQGTVEAFSGLASLYLDRAELVGDDVFERVETLRNAARIFEEHLQQPESALVVMLSAYGPENIDDAALVGDVERLARQTGMWEEAVARLTDILGEIGDSLEAATLHTTVGLWRAQELNQLDEAVYHLQRALSIDPDNVETMKTLEDLFRRLAAWPELANVLRLQVDACSEPEERMELWRRLGELYELQMGQIDESIDAYREVLLIDPQDILAMESLERAFEALGRWEDLVAILGQKATATYDPEQIVEIKSRVALIWEDRLDDVAQAILSYQEVLAADQAHAPALESLERLFTQTAQWNEVIDVYEQRLQLTHEPDEQVQIYGRMAAVFETQFEDYDRAVEAYNNVLMVDVENETAIENLERLYRMLERWFDLVDVLQRHIEIAQYGTQKVELLAELGRVQRDHARDPHAAVEAFAAALEIDRGQTELWRELAGLYEVTSNWESAIEAYTQLVDRVEGEDDRIAIYHRMGQIYETELHNEASAEEAYNAALRRAPEHPEILDALRGLYGRQHEWQGLVRILKQAEGASRDLAAKARYLTEIGATYQDHLEDTVSALRYFETALEADPKITAAAQPLIDVYIREQRWERAIPLLEMVVEQIRDQPEDVQNLHKRHLQLGLAYENLAQIELSLQEYRNAYELAPNDLQTLRGLGSLLYRNNELEQASKVLQTLQFQHQDKLEHEELVDVYYKLGSIRRKLGELRGAVQFFEKALEIEQHHRPTLQAVVDTYTEQGKWEQVVHYSRWILETEQDQTARFALLAKIGDIHGGKLNQPQQAVGAYVEALDLDAKSVVILRKLLDLYTKTKQWHEAVQILLRIIEQETDGGRAAKYYYTAAVIYRDEIENPAEAVNLFEKALDTDVKMLKAFEAIDRLLTEAKDWKNLSRAYRRMLHRVSENDDGSMEKIKTLLWQNLGEIYRSRLGDLKTATEAYKIAVGLNPENQALRLILAELYEKTGDNPDGAIEQHRELIKLDPFRVESYRVLFKSYIQTKNYDKAWCMAGALTFLQSASEQEQKFYKQYLGANLQAAKGQFNQDMFKRLYHEEQDILMSFILSILGQALRTNYYSQPIKNWGVHKKRDLLNLEEPNLFCKIYTYSARTMGLVPAPQVYLRADQALGMRNANADPPAVIIGGDVRQKVVDRELAFIISKTLCWMLPQHYLGSVGYPTEFLKLLFMALMDLTDPSMGIGKTLGEQGDQIKREIGAIPAQLQMQLQKMMKQYLAKGENPNLSRWVTSVEHTSIRMGLLLCGDIHTAANCIKNDTMPLGKASVKDKIREMVLFSISEEYFQLREELGLAIGK